MAAVCKALLEEHDLVVCPKTSGSRGIHIYVRIEPRWEFIEVRRAAVAFAREVERRAPAVATTAWWKEECHGVFLDFNQNARDKTIASAYSVRETGRVSAPFRWDELDSIDPLALDLPGFAARWEAVGDLAAGMDAASGRLDACSRSPTRTTSAASPTCRGRRTTRSSRTSRRASHHRGTARTQPGRPPRRRAPRTPRPAVPAAFPSATPI